MGEVVVANASPLIAFSQIGQLDILQRLFGGVVIPPAVVLEIAPSVVRPDWMTAGVSSEPLDERIVASSLDLGESEAISLALELGAKYVLLDDRRGRLVARQLRLPVTGTLGVLRLAKRQGVITEVGPHINALAAVGFHMTPELLEQVLVDSGEAE